MMDWIRWRWFCFWHAVCPKHATFRIAMHDMAWCPDCEREYHERNNKREFAIATKLQQLSAKRRTILPR